MHPGPPRTTAGLGGTRRTGAGWSPQPPSVQLNRLDLNGKLGLAVALAGGRIHSRRGDLVQRREPRLVDGAKGGVVRRQRGVLVNEEELAAVGTRSGVGH